MMTSKVVKKSLLKKGFQTLLKLLVRLCVVFCWEKGYKLFFKQFKTRFKFDAEVVELEMAYHFISEGRVSIKSIFYRKVIEHRGNFQLH